MNRSIKKSVGKNGSNLQSDVAVVQSLLNDNIEKLVPFLPVPETGLIGPHTIFAIEEFQRRVVGLQSPDGRVDPGGKTLKILNEAVVVVPVAGPKPNTPAGQYTLTFSHGGTKPPSKANGKTDSLYESSVSLAGPKSGTFRGSIYPDDLSVRGRLKDGSYPIYLGFHKRAGKTPKAAHLKAESQGFRAALIVNNDAAVNVDSDNSAKKTSSAIHVHNGFSSQRFSDGCPTLHPDDWADFIKLFLIAFPDLSDWTATSTYVGRKIGTLVVEK